MSTQRALGFVSAAAIALAAAISAIHLGQTYQATGLVRFLIVAFGSAPLAVVLGRLSSRPFWAWLTVATGLVLSVLGVWRSLRNDALHLITMDFSVIQVAINAADVMAPIALTGLGLVLLLAGAAWRTHDRLLTGLATISGTLLSLIYAVALLAHAARSLPYIGGAVSPALVTAAGIVALAALLLPVVVVSGPGGSEIALPSRTTAIRVPASLLVLALLAGVGYWTYDRLANRTKLAELFPDPALAGCVATTLGLTDAEQPTSQRKLDSVFSLSCNGDQSTSGRIRSLAGLEHLPNLGTLDVSTNELNDVIGLDQVPGLTSLKLTNNRVRDLTPLATLTELRELGASNNRIADLTPLHNLKDLSAVGLSGNQITEVSALANLTTIAELDLARNQITDVSALSALATLDRLTLRENNLQDLTPLTGLTALTMLDIAGNQVTDLKPLTRMPLVDELWLGGNPVQNLKPLRQMKALQGVDLEGSDPYKLVGVDELRDAGVYVGGLA
ncbi:leucine-rich repeat domain-containing protein [Kineosporia babensis]|uniref:Leucine-rich repeat domain-containing protein n=1 Tax=Kineosporia babensis TaxID=499548 RepID=A0A9X1NC55_9ACTN|nr:leucine-rich repeat domain-containing protein [Kineosporia babensis]MCD5310338.1 hypothetical protein [Kineosporia babensis]